MGQQASRPRPGTKLQVIGAGLSRTGTASFSRALEILLDGPIYHGGTQATLGPEIEIKSWIKVLSHWPPRNDSDKRLILDLIASRMDGYAATTDAPASGLVPELLELYPDAKVICTVRDPKSWEKSMEGISNAATMWFLRGVLFPLPALRYFVDYINVLREAWIKLYGESEPVTTLTYDRHIAWLKRTVPKDRLFFFDIKDGWEPLCAALGKDVPEGVPFPRINDGEAIDRFAKKHVQRGLVRWAEIFAAGLALVAVILMWR
ncbi:MAG: hypothetical protein LQ338_006355 [Usnochroma carphineum]|nr:MAG: hypothetical protein LQ338_006355 [Usnochroma carphineum]